MRATGTEYCLTQLTMAVYYAIVVMGLCLLMGYAGQVSLGHGAFFAIGGYTSAVLTTHDLSAFKDTAWAGWLQQAHLLVAKQDLYGNAALTVSPWAAFLAAMLVTFLIALLIGYPALRLRGHYLAMATLGFGLIVSKMLLGSAITGAADGINGVPEWKLLPGLTVTGKSAARVQNYYIACGLALLRAGVAAQPRPLPRRARAAGHSRPRDRRQRHGHQHRRLQAQGLRPERPAGGHGRRLLHPLHRRHRALRSRRPEVRPLRGAGGRGRHGQPLGCDRR